MCKECNNPEFSDNLHPFMLLLIPFLIPFLIPYFMVDLLYLVFRTFLYLLHESSHLLDGLLHKL